MYFAYIIVGACDISDIIIPFVPVIFIIFKYF